MSWLTAGWAHLGIVAAKASLMYGGALLLLRVGERRTLAQWTIIDFVTAVAIGAVVGRTAVAGGQALVTGLVALATFVTVHRVASLLRFSPLINKLADHRVRVLVAHGRVRRRQLRLCGLTDNDLFAQLRQRGYFSLTELRYVLYETKGSITVVPETAPADTPLVDAGIEGATGYP